jgi:signal transduction histidine kinase
MEDIQLLIEDDGNRNAVTKLMRDGGYAVTVDGDVRDSDMYIVDDYTLPKYREALRATKRERSPVFCPVMLIRRERTRLNLDVEYTRDDETVLIDEIISAPVNRPALHRRLTNLLVRRNQTKELAERNERLDSFVRKVSHELRNPLSILKGYIPVAQETGEAEHFELLERSTDQMDRMVDDLLALARTGDLNVEREPVSLPDVIDDCWKATRNPQATIETRTTATISADEDRLHQLLSNLLRNAIEHAGPDVTVRVGDLPDGFYVEDDGPGIPEEERETLLEWGTSSYLHGAGLGLSIVMEVADAHGWSQSLVGSDEGGARFEFHGVDRR